MVFEYLTKLLKRSKSARVEGIEQAEEHKKYEAAISALENMFINPLIFDSSEDVKRLGKIVKDYEIEHPLCRIDGKVFYLAKDNNKLLAQL